MTSETHSVLLVTKNAKFSTQVSPLLIPPLFELSVCGDFNEARRKCGERLYDIILVDFADGEGCDFAVDVSDTSSIVLLLVPQELFERISYKVESYGILSLGTSFDQFYFYNMLKAAIAVRYKVRLISSQTTRLKEKIEEIRLVNRAKLILMQTKSMTEEEAHRYLEKEAMGSRMTKKSVAESIIKGSAG